MLCTLKPPVWLPPTGLAFRWHDYIRSSRWERTGTRTLPLCLVRSYLFWAPTSVPSGCSPSLHPLLAQHLVSARGQLLRMQSPARASELLTLPPLSVQRFLATAPNWRFGDFDGVHLPSEEERLADPDERLLTASSQPTASSSGGACTPVLSFWRTSFQTHVWLGSPCVGYLGARCVLRLTPFFPLKLFPAAFVPHQLPEFPNLSTLCRPIVPNRSSAPGAHGRTDQHRCCCDGATHRNRPSPAGGSSPAPYGAGGAGSAQCAEQCAHGG